MKELFPLNTFQQDAVLKRLNDLLDNDKELDDKMPYDEDTDTYNIDDNLAVDGKISGDEIVENMSGYSFNLASVTGYTLEKVYVSACKNGNKLTLVMAFNITRDEDNLTGNVDIGQFIIPEDIGSKLIPSQVGSYEYLSNQYVSIWLNAWTQKQQIFVFKKADNTHLNAYFDSSANTNLTKSNKYYCRVEMTFLLGESL